MATYSSSTTMATTQRGAGPTMGASAIEANAPRNMAAPELATTLCCDVVFPVSAGPGAREPAGQRARVRLRNRIQRLIASHSRTSRVAARGRGHGDG